MDQKIIKALHDFTVFAPAYLVISTKAGSLAPFTLNRAQLYTHEKLEAQLRDTGKVRAILLKGRQMGLSTLIQGRYFHKVITRKGTKAYILTHHSDATQNLFDMTMRYYDNLPPGLAPIADTSSAKELKFKSLQSGYDVGTAGSKEIGRSLTLQLFHGCLAEGSLIFNPLDGGIKNIESFEVGDWVLTHQGHIAPISFISQQEKECISVKFRTMTTFPLVATQSHKVWTQEGWKELGELKIGDSIGYPIRKLESRLTHLRLPLAPLRSQHGGRQCSVSDVIPLNYHFGLIVGLYLAEGHIKLQSKAPHYPSSITFTVHRKEVERTLVWLARFSDYFSSIKIKHRENSFSSQVIIYGNRFAQLLNHLCGRVASKHCPIHWYEMGEDFCRGMLHGYLSGDGGSYANERKIAAPSIRHTITVTMRDIAASLGYGWAMILYRKGAIRHGRNEKDQYTFVLAGDGASRLAQEIGKPTLARKRKLTRKSKKSYASHPIEISNGYAWLRIREIEPVGLKKVYDFEVNHPDHSYCAIQGAVSNSEVGFWPNAESHAKGVLNAVSDEPGTEIILESTANGIGNYFHTMWQAAKKGLNGYIPIFTPWYWETKYMASTENFRLSDEEEQLLSLYKEDGMTLGHIAWRRLKISSSKDIDAGIEAFKQEYPCCDTEAFLNPVANIFINSRLVAKARQQRVESEARLVIGVDVAISSFDKTAIIRRKGRVAYNLETFRNMNTMEIAGMLKHVIEREKPYRVYIDCIGVGAGVVDRLREQGYHFVVGVNVARSANQRDRYRNLRAELWDGIKDWLSQEMPVQLPDSDELHGDLCNLGYKYDSSGRLQIESKDDLKARGMASPDTADALALTFYSGFYEDLGESSVTTIPAQKPGMFI